MTGSNGQRKAKRAPRGGRRSRRGMFVDTAPLFRVPPAITHKFVRTQDLGLITPAASDQGYAYSFALSSLPSASELTALYDMYRIDLIEVIVELYAINQTTSTQAFPTLIAWPDYDDATAPSTLSASTEVAQAERFQFSPTHNQFKRALVPRLSVGVWDGAATSHAMVATKSEFVDCATPAIPHYGFKCWIKWYNTSLDNFTGLNLSFRYHLSMRQPR